MNNAQSDQSSSASKDPLPAQRGGLFLFGYYLDPLEIISHVLVLAILGIPAIRASVKDGYSPKDGMAWISAIIGASTFVRLSPTDRVNAYFKLNASPLNHDKSI